MTGINYVVGHSYPLDTDAVAAVCTQFTGDRVTGGEHALRIWGDHNFKYRVDSFIKCSAGMAAEQIVVQISTSKLVHTFALICRNPQAHDYQSSQFGYGFGDGLGEMAFQQQVGCGGGALAVGIVGRYGSAVDALGLLCKIIADVPSPPPDQGNFKPITKLKVTPTAPPTDNGNATAEKDTTIYNLPEGNDVAYLQAGDSVTIVSCGDNNWCEISEPRKGYVWGDDLNR
ncbi:MAG: SH3 domain-containing protein [Devosia sp.]